MQDSQSLEQAKSFFLSGLEKLNGDDFAGAEKDFESSLKFAPNRLSIIVNLSIVLIKANKLKKAEMIIREGLDYHFKNKDLLLSLVEIYKRIISFDKNFQNIIPFFGLLKQSYRAVIFSFCVSVMEQPGWICADLSR